MILKFIKANIYHDYCPPKMACMQGKRGFVVTMYVVFVVICLATVIILTQFPPKKIINERAPGKASSLMKPSKKVHTITKFTRLPEKFMENVTIANTVTFTILPWKYTASEERYFITFLVKSAAKYVSRRFLLRRTWGSVSQINGKRFGLIFMIGQTNNKSEQAMVQEESDLYGDILQSSVLDGYHFLPEKVLSGFKYLTTEAGDITDFIITTDDDCYINIQIVYDYFGTDSQQKRQAIHCGFSYDVNGKPVRDTQSKWYMSPSIYPGEYYPPFCHGGMVVMSYYHVLALYDNSLKTNKTGLYLEDVLIFGILREKTQNSRFRIVPYGYNGAVGKLLGHEPLVYHLAHGHTLTSKMAERWIHSLQHLKFKNTTREAPLIAQFLSSFRDFPTRINKTVNETIFYFTKFWGVT